MVDKARLFIPLADMIDIDKERARLEKELEKATQEIMRLEQKLSNDGFVTKAPPAVVQSERDKLETYRARLTDTKKALESLTQTAN